MERQRVPIWRTASKSRPSWRTLTVLFVVILGLFFICWRYRSAMDGGRWTDLIIGLAQAGFGMFLAWRAFIVGLSALPEPERQKHRTVFSLCSLAVILLAGVQTYRSFGLDKKLEKIEANTERQQAAPIINIPPPVVNIPSPTPRPEHAKVSWIYLPLPINNFPLLPLRIGEVPTIGFGFQNIGDFDVLSPNTGVTIAVISKAEIAGSFARMYPGIVRRGDTGTFPPHTTEMKYASYTGPALTKEDVNGLSDGTRELCAIGSVWWKDTTGGYDTRLFRCMFVQLDHSFNWETLPEDNTEHRR
jgi:hypothetical protein